VFTGNPAIDFAIPFIAFGVIMGSVIGAHQWWVRIGRPRRRNLADLHRPIAVVRDSEARGLLKCVARLELSPDPDDQRWANHHLWMVRTWLLDDQRRGGGTRAAIRRTTLLDDVEARLEARGAMTLGRHDGLVDDLAL
jgi:hypothetical protein